MLIEWKYFRIGLSWFPKVPASLQVIGAKKHGDLEWVENKMESAGPYAGDSKQSPPSPIDFHLHLRLSRSYARLSMGSKGGEIQIKSIARMPIFFLTGISTIFERGCVGTQISICINRGSAVDRTWAVGRGSSWTSQVGLAQLEDIHFFLRLRTVYTVRRTRWMFSPPGLMLNEGKHLCSRWVYWYPLVRSPCRRWPSSQGRKETSFKFLLSSRHSPPLMEVRRISFFRHASSRILVEKSFFLNRFIYTFGRKHRRSMICLRTCCKTEWHSRSIEELSPVVRGPVQSGRERGEPRTLNFWSELACPACTVARNRLSYRAG